MSDADKTKLNAQKDQIRYLMKTYLRTNEKQISNILKMLTTLDETTQISLKCLELAEYIKIHDIKNEGDYCYQCLLNEFDCREIDDSLTEECLIKE
jgi:hypothetical protein